MSSPRERILTALEAENAKLREALNKITDWDIEGLRECGDHPDWQTFLQEFHEGERLLERVTKQSNDAPMEDNQ